MNHEIVKKLMDDPVNGGIVLRASLINFIKFFHFYIYNTPFIFKPFHYKIVKKLEDIVFGRNVKRNLVINIPPRFGKLIEDSTPVLTRYGWKNHGDIVIGDEVLNEKGEFVKVQAISPKMIANMKVRFSDGDEVLCHENHEWVIESAGHKKTRESKWLMNRSLYLGTKGKRGCSYNYHLPKNSPIIGESRELPIKPYSLGAWLGDGTNTRPWITGDINDKAILDKIVDEGYELNKQYIHKATGVISSIFPSLKNDLMKEGMCIYGRKTIKHIPDIYFTASQEQRLSLLAGLLDTDGYLSKKENRYRFTTSEEQLKDDFISLVSTFGWRVSVLEQSPRLSSSGIQGKKSYWIVSFNPDLYIPCQLERKKLENFSKSRRVSFVDVEKGNFGQGNCIQVEGGIYLVGRRLKPTHNSQIMKYFEAWSYMVNPSCNFIVTSYSEDLVIQNSKEVRNILTSPAFQKFCPVEIKSDVKAADYWETKQGGGFRAAPMGGGIIGFGAGVTGNEYGGALICFPYHQKIATEKGYCPIGDIVNNKLNLKVWSYNIKTKTKELKEIDNWLKNPSSDLYKVILSDGSSFEATPTHKIWTENRGYVELQKLNSNDILLSFSDSFDLVDRKTKLFHYIFPRFIFIQDKFKIFLREVSKFSRGVVDFLCIPFKRFSFFNTNNCTSLNIVTGCNNPYWSRVCTYVNNIFSRKISARKNQSSMFNSIFHVIRLSAISKITNNIIKWVTIKMPYFDSFSLNTNKRPSHSLMNRNTFNFGFIRWSKVKVSLAKSWFYNSTLKFIRTSFPLNNSVLTPDSSKGTDTIQTFKTGYLSPLFIYKVGHIDNSYCLTIRDNHNMFVGKSQAILAKNCDDPLKASNVKSQIEIQNGLDYYTDTLKSRLNNKLKTPTILIMQRLSVDDLTGYVTEYEKDDWDWLKIPALDENTGLALWEEKYPASELLKLKDQLPFIYYGQYQQEPTVLGGTVFKSEWWRFYRQDDDFFYTRIWMVVDGAQKKGEANDYTVVTVWGVTSDEKLHLLDMMRGKFDAVELENNFVAFWEKWKYGNNGVIPYGVYIEDKSSGIGLIQQLSVKHAIPVLAISRAAYKKPDGKMQSMDKYTRATNAVPRIAAGLVHLPNSEKDVISSQVISEGSAFKADLTHKHDDIMDTVIDAIDIAYGNTSVNSVFI